MKAPKPLTLTDDLWVGAPLQAKSDGAQYKVGLAKWTKFATGWEYVFPIKNQQGEVIARLRLAEIRKRFVRPASN